MSFLQILTMICIVVVVGTPLANPGIFSNTDGKTLGLYLFLCVITVVISLDLFHALWVRWRTGEWPDDSGGVDMT